MAIAGAATFALADVGDASMLERGDVIASTARCVTSTLARAPRFRLFRSPDSADSASCDADAPPATGLVARAAAADGADDVDVLGVDGAAAGRARAC